MLYISAYIADTKIPDIDMKDKQMNEAPTKVYVGARENIIREIGGLSHIYRGRYLAQFDGDAAWDAEGCDSLADMRDMIAEYQLIYPNLEVIWL